MARTDTPNLSEKKGLRAPSNNKRVALLKAQAARDEQRQEDKRIAAELARKREKRNRERIAAAIVAQCSQSQPQASA